MKHYFIVNPIAGKTNATEFIEQCAKNIIKDNYVIYVTKDYNDAYLYTKKICEEDLEDKIFYACGGDGTTSEVVNGIIGYDNAYFTVIPTGSCNDFLRTFPDYDFFDLSRLKEGNFIEIDAIKVNDRYAINIANCGFDAKVNYDVSLMKLKHIDVDKAYSKSIIKRIIFRHDDKIKVIADNELIDNKKYLLTVFANAEYYGSGIHSAPFAKVDDGLIDMMLVDSISVLKFKKFFESFNDGTYLSKGLAKDIIKYKQVKEVTISSNDKLCMCIDGETFFSKEFNIKVVPKAIKFVLPLK